MTTEKRDDRQPHDDEYWAQRLAERKAQRAAAEEQARRGRRSQTSGQADAASSQRVARVSSATQPLQATPAQGASQARQGRRAQARAEASPSATSQASRAQARQGQAAQGSNRPRSAAGAGSQDGFATQGQLRQQSAAQQPARYDDLDDFPYEPLTPRVPGGQAPSSDDGYEWVEEKKRSKLPRIIGIVVLIVVIAAIALVASLGVSAFNLKDQAVDAAKYATALKSDIDGGDYTAATQDAKLVQSLCKQIEDEMSGPQWTVAGALPVVGNDVTAVKQLLEAADSAMGDTLMPLLATMQRYPLSDLIHDGTINVDAANALLDTLAGSLPSLVAAKSEIESLPEPSIPVVKELVDKLKDKIGSYFGALTSYGDTLESYQGLINLAKVVLGDGDRSYLLVAQNAAETRSTGGYPGAAGTLSITGGKISMGEFLDKVDAFGEDVPEGVEFTSEEQGLFGSDNHLTSADNFGIDPDFPRVAEVWLGAYEQANGESCDGVIAIEPSVIQDLLAITGSITLSDGTELDGDNATRVLQHDLYLKYFSDEDAYEDDSWADDAIDDMFAEAAQATFDKVMGNLNSKNLLKLADVFASSMADRTIFVWMADDAEQAKTAGANASGALSSSTTEPALGVYLNLRESSKLGWFLDAETSVEPLSTNADGSKTYRVTTVVSNALTKSELAATRTSDYLYNDDGDIYPIVYLYAPAGGSISDVETDANVEPDYATHEGHDVVWLYRPNVLPEQSITITYKVTTGAGATADLSVIQTPTLTSYRLAG